MDLVMERVSEIGAVTLQVANLSNGASQGRVVFGASTLVKPRFCWINDKVLSFFQDGVKFIEKSDSFKVNY
jgi:hypothetical protein